MCHILPWLSVPDANNILSVPHANNSLAVPNANNRLSAPDANNILSVPHANNRLAVPDANDGLPVPDANNSPSMSALTFPCVDRDVPRRLTNNGAKMNLIVNLGLCRRDVPKKTRMTAPEVKSDTEEVDVKKCAAHFELCGWDALEFDPRYSLTTLQPMLFTPALIRAEAAQTMTLMRT